MIMKKIFTTLSLTLILLLGVRTTSLAQTTLSPGDIVILEFNGNGTDGFTFMPLVDLQAGTQINFTDYGWGGSSFQTGEEAGSAIGNMITYTAPSAITAGTMIRQDKANIGGSAFTATAGWAYNYNSLNYINALMSTSAGHDGLIAFQGTPSSPSFIWAWQSGSWGGTDYYWNSELPTGLTNGVNAIYFADFASGADLTVDDGYYLGSTAAADAATWRSRVANSANWTTLASGTAPALLYPGSYTIISSNNAPTDISLSATSIDENVSGGSTVGMLSTTDPDVGNTFTYSLVAGTGSGDNGSFSISGSSLLITNSPNYESKSSYSVRVRSTDQGGLWSEDAFTITINNLNTPTLTTTSVTTYNSTSATLGGEISTDGGEAVTERGVVYAVTSINSDPLIGGTGVTQDNNGTGTGTFSESILGLTPNTQYSVKAYAINVEGTSYGTVQPFTTLAVAPTVTTQAVSSIAATTSTGNGNITALGVPNPTAYGVCWNTTGTPTTSDGKVDKGAASATGAFTVSLTSLSANTTYYVRAFATNSAGTTYGSQVSFTTKTIPAITWSNPADITYGTLLNTTQLNATANIAGTFTYTPALGTKLNAGNGQTLQVDFTPTDLTNFEATSKAVSINVAKVTPLITWSNPTEITYGTLLSATQLNATADVEGSIVYTPAIDTKLNAGAAQDLKADFTPTDAANYNTASKTVTIDVAKETPVITWSNPADINNETALSSIQLNAIADVAGIFTYTPAIGVKLNVGDSQALKADFEPTDAVNYESASKTVYINVMLTTGISEVGTNKFLIFPNPVIDFFSVSGIEGRAKISLSDLNGRVILTKEISNNEMISLDNLSRGIYIITLEDINGFASMKIVKK